MYTKDQIEKAVKSKGYVWFEDPKDKGYDVNIVGIRNSETGDEVTNKFDDKITISYKVNGEWKFHCYDCTTDPGRYWVENIMRKEGVAALKEGQYRRSHKIRLHAGKYPALGQQNPVTVYRDANKDGCYDLSDDNTQTGLYGINIHRATAREGKKSTKVDKWSAGCQVIAANKDWKEFMDICYKAREIWGNNFTYTLIESKDII
jgi:hypothetical protein|tara:strand:- start:9287 stop:9898 length:612 start_codon:yes stop_codon:yes gene_type:complete